MRMATLAPAARIDVATVREEEQRLVATWAALTPSADDGLVSVLSEKQIAELDLFDRVQLAEVVRVCRQASSLSEAGRQLFAVSRAKRRSSNDADRLRKYLARFNLSYQSLRS